MKESTISTYLKGNWEEVKSAVVLSLSGHKVLVTDQVRIGSLPLLPNRVSALVQIFADDVCFVEFNTPLLWYSSEIFANEVKYTEEEPAELLFTVCDDEEHIAEFKKNHIEQRIVNSTMAALFKDFFPHGTVRPKYAPEFYSWIKSSEGLEKFRVLSEYFRKIYEEESRNSENR